MTNKSEPAFPVPEILVDGTCGMAAAYQGLTKREYFAAMAMQGLLANGNHVAMTKHDIKQELVNQYIAIFSINLADALIEELNK